MLKMKHRGFIINVKDRRDRRVFSRYGHGLSLMLAVFNCKFTPIIYVYWKVNKASFESLTGLSNKEVNIRGFY